MFELSVDVVEEEEKGSEMGHLNASMEDENGDVNVRVPLNGHSGSVESEVVPGNAYRKMLVFEMRKIDRERPGHKETEEKPLFYLIQCSAKVLRSEKSWDR